MKYGDIDWNTERGLAYREAKSSPGKNVRFQAENGFAVTRYVKGSPAVEIVGLRIDGKPGYWFERPVLDMTKITPDANDIGFRVYDEGDGDVEDL